MTIVFQSNQTRSQNGRASYKPSLNTHRKVGMAGSISNSIDGAHSDDNYIRLNDRCIALRDTRILSEDVRTWQRVGARTVYDVNNCRNVAGHMTSGTQRKGCMPHRVETNNKLDNCSGWPVLWLIRKHGCSYVETANAMT